MHIRTLGNTVQLCRWQVDYTMNNPDETTTPMTEYVPTEEEADALINMYGGTKLMIDTVGDEWIDGITVVSLDQAREIAAKGEVAYKQSLAKKDYAGQLEDLQLALAELYEKMV